jgi:hypothetical protein
MAVFSNVGIHIDSIDLNVTAFADEFDRISTFFGRQINAESQFQSRKQLETGVLKLEKNGS